MLSGPGMRCFTVVVALGLLICQVGFYVYTHHDQCLKTNFFSEGPNLITCPSVRNLVSVVEENIGKTRMLGRDSIVPCFAQSWVQNQQTENVSGVTLEDSGGPWGPGPPCPQDFFKIMQFSEDFKGKTPILSKFQALAPLGSKLCWAPLTKILDPRLGN